MDIIIALETACWEKVSTIQADWGGEFRNTELETELRHRGTKMQETVPHHSETNPVVERANRTIFSMNCTSLATSGLHKGPSDVVSAFSVYTKNRVPDKALNGASPRKRMFPETDLAAQRSNLRKFREKVICFAYDAQDKLSPTSYEARIVSYTHTHGTYRVLTKHGATKIANNPRPITKDNDDAPLVE